MTSRSAERANQRVEKLHEAGIMDARLYGNDPDDGVGGTGVLPSCC